MHTRVAFLRAINLGPKRKFPAADIRRVLTDAGYTDVATHLATGNARFAGGPSGQADTEAAMEALFLADRGFEVPTVVFTADELRRVAADTDALAAGRALARHYVYLLRAPLPPDVVSALAERTGDRGEMVARGRAVHALLGPGYEDGVVDPLRAVRLLPPEATNRNARVLRDLAARWA